MKISQLLSEKSQKQVDEYELRMSPLFIVPQ